MRRAFFVLVRALHNSPNVRDAILCIIFAAAVTLCTVAAMHAQQALRCTPAPAPSAPVIVVPRTAPQVRQCDPGVVDPAYACPRRSVAL